MVSRLRPVDISVIFDDRPYKLGEAIDLTVELIPRSDVKVREGRIDLECEASYTETFTVTMPDRRGMRGSAGIPVPTAMDRRQVTEKHTDTFVHSSVVFLEDEAVRAGTTRRFRTTLQIDSQPPRGSRGTAHRGRSDFTWSLVARVDVIRARDIAERYAVQVTGVAEEKRVRNSKLTPEQRRENARKAANARWDKARKERSDASDRDDAL